MPIVRVRVLCFSLAAVSWLLVGADQPRKLASDYQLDILRDSIRANKKALVAANMQLSSDEAQRFWPIYDRYDKDRKTIDDRYIQIVQDYTAQFQDMTDDQAIKLLNDYLAVEADRVKLRQDYATQFAAAVPGLKAARFFQIENKMDAIARYDLAATIPVIKQ
jgi:hypothetical protein